MTALIGNSQTIVVAFPEGNGSPVDPEISLK
jgi:hypothetical protein